MLPTPLRIGIESKEVGYGATKVTVFAVNDARLQIAALAPAIDVRLRRIGNALLQLGKHVLICERKVVPRAAKNFQLNRGLCRHRCRGVRNLSSQNLFGLREVAAI